VTNRMRCGYLLISLTYWMPNNLAAETMQVTEQADQIMVETSTIQAAIRKQGYVSGVAGGSFVDKQTGAVWRPSDRSW